MIKKDSIDNHHFIQRVKLANQKLLF